jgi:mono/diheme cytochrome c family protein
MQKRSVLPVALATALLLAALGALVAAAVVYGGVYPVEATRQHLQPTYSLLETAMRQSVRRSARDVVEPPLADERMALRGAACFRDKCVQCHGAPGVAQGDIGKSMQPLPGPLVDAAHHWRPRELYWLTRNGIKMSGMPAWEYRLSEAELWDVVAFLRRLPDLNAPQYAQWTQQAPGTPACGRDAAAGPPAGELVDVERGRRALSQYACNACHTIPGITSSSPQVGPPLDGIATRRLIAGTLVNTPDNLALWLMQTQQVKPGTAMPDMGVLPQDARDIAAYLGMLR